MSVVDLLKDSRDFLLIQGKKSLHSDNTCAYRGIDNTKCAVGCLIPDELYDPEMETKGPAQLLYSFDYLKEYWCEIYDIHPRLLYRILGHIQLIHDKRSVEVADWPEEFNSLIRAFES